MKGLELRAESDDDVIDQLVVGDGTSDHGQGISIALHLVEVLSSRLIKLLRRRQLATELPDARSVLGGKHGGEACPNGGGGVPPNHLAEDLLGHGSDKDAEDALVRVPPKRIRRIGLRDGGSSFAGGDRLSRRNAAPVEKAVPPCAGDARNDLGPP